MTIKIFSIEKVKKDNYYDIITDYKKMISKYARVEDYPLFNKEIASSQNAGSLKAKKSYSEVFESRMCRYNVALHPDGKMVDSFKFSELFGDRSEIAFFIGGAYGLEESFIRKCDLALSLSSLTMSHKVAKLVLFEQIYRAFTIIHNHPYHK